MKTLFLIGSLSLLFSCGQGVSKIAAALKPDPNTDPPLKIDTFSVFPPEIDGCSCYFSSDSLYFKEKKYILMDDFAKTAFMKLNGTMKKFERTSNDQTKEKQTKAVYKSGDYELILETKTIRQSGDETTLETGTMRLTEKSGKTVIKAVYGECGC